MMDLAYIALTLVLFALSWGLIVVCDRLMEANHERPVHLVGLISLGLFVYLVFALLKPEWFG